MTADEMRQIRVEAARWLARLHSGDIDLAGEAEFEHWQRRSPEHARCIAQINERIDHLQASSLRNLQGEQLNRTLSTPHSRRRFLRGSLAIGATAVGTLLLSRLGRSGFAWPGDLYTGVGERNDFQLQDGSHLSLNAASRVSPRFSGQSRTLLWQTGELLLDVRAQHRPFRIEAPGTQIEAQAQRLLLRQESDTRYIAALDNPLRLQTASGWQSLDKGHWARLHADGTWQRGQLRQDDTLWLKGLLEADAMPLRSVIDALRPYRLGLIQLSPAVADLRVSGLLPLDDSDHALAMLSSIAPIRITRLTEFWVKVEAA